MAINDSVCGWGLLLLFMVLVNQAFVEGCACPSATILAQFPSKLLPESCCLNFSGSFFGDVALPEFTNYTNIEILDLSHCNISHIEIGAAGLSSLKELYLNHNALTTLPGDFLTDLPSLRVVDLGINQLKELPEGFLQGSDNLRELNLKGNRLQLLPASVLHKPVQRLALSDNLWDCSCPLVDLLDNGVERNTTSGLQDLLGNLTCASPRSLAGRNVWSINRSDVCRPPGLTALFILLPLLILAALVLCWCCGQKKNKKKETPAFGPSKKKKASSHLDSNGQKHHSKQHIAGGEAPKEGILKNQLLLRPASTLLGSTRDIYEEVEIKLGSVESLPHARSLSSSTTEGRATGEIEMTGKAELDAVSVTEVMKDSSDREKAYLTQSTEYYSLVPGMDLEDSDHGEYESVDLS